MSIETRTEALAAIAEIQGNRMMDINNNQTDELIEDLRRFVTRAPVYVTQDEVEIAEADLAEALEPEDEDAYKGMDTLDLAQHLVRIVLGSLQIAVQR